MRVLSYPASGNELVWSTPAAGGANKIDDLSDALLNTSKNNLFLGHNANTISTSNDYNVAVGITALDAITTGNKNTAVGHKSLSMNEEGEANTAIGSEALSENEDGKWNTALGYQALVQSTGDNNVAFGFQSGNNVTAGYDNVFIGKGAKASTGGASSTINQIVIGANADGNGNNTTTIGNSNTIKTYLKGVVDINSDLDLGGDINVIGNSNVTGNSTVTGNAIMTGTATISGATYISGPTSLQNSLQVDAGSQFNDDVRINSSGVATDKTH